MYKKNNLSKRTKELINNDRINIAKIKVVATENEKNINILDDCKRFCEKYKNVNFEDLKIKDLKHIYDEGQGLINTYFITCSKEGNEIDKTIIRLETIVTNANNTLSTKQIEKLKESIVRISKESRSTMHKSRKIDKDLKNRAKQLEKLKSDQKSIITTIISIVLAISIIPTAVAGIQNIDSNYILPFLSSIILFGIIMISFTYSIYSGSLKKRLIVFLMFVSLLCGFTWYICFNYDISINKKGKQDESVKNNITNNNLNENNNL